MPENNINLKKLGCYLGVDYGDVRTGLAKTDLSRFLAGGIGYIKPGGMRNTAVAVAQEAKKSEAIKIIVGLPKNMDGSEGERAKTVRIFADILATLTDIPIDFCDERLTTVEAYSFLNITDTASRKRRSVIDTLSAQIMLQDYIDRENLQKK